MDPYYQNNDVILYKGDCLQVMPQLDMTFDCCITDPPYGTTACKWDSVIPFEPMWEQLKRLVKSRGAICLFGAEPFSSKLRLSNLPMFKYDWYWNKKSTSGFINAKNKPMNTVEIISIFSEGKTSNGNRHNMSYYPQGLKPFGKLARRGNKKEKENTYWRPSTQQNCNFQTYTNYPRNYLEMRYQSGSVHPTQKPVALIEYLVKTYTNEGELVLDFTAGSGTTGVAAMNTNRKCVLIEREGKYCDIIIKRLKEKELEIAERLFR